MNSKVVDCQIHNERMKAMKARCPTPPDEHSDNDGVNPGRASVIRTSHSVVGTRGRQQTPGRAGLNMPACVESG